MGRRQFGQRRGKFVENFIWKLKGYSPPVESLNQNRPPTLSVLRNVGALHNESVVFA